MPNGVRLQEVADLAGVSIGTASQALNDRPSVASETRARVIDAARTLGYPIKRRTERIIPDIDVIGMLTKHDAGYPPNINPFYSVVQAGVESECRKQNISLMYANIEVDGSNHPVAWPPMLTEERVDGLLLVGTFIEDTVDIFKRRLDLPSILIDAYAPNLPYDSILIDNAGGTRTAVEHLIRHGHRRIGLIGTHPDSPPSVLERRVSFLNLMGAFGLSRAYVEDSELSYDAGDLSLRRLLQRAPEVTAVFASADLVAIGALNAARSLGIAVPENLSIIGFDDIDSASVVTPALTTVHVHKTRMGSLGVCQLLSRVAEPLQPKVTISVSTRLVERDSVGVAR